MSHHTDTLSDRQLVKLAEKYGTPLYVYHAEKIMAQQTRLQQAFSKTRVRFFYAAKALTNINILKLMQQAGCGLDTVSIQEVQLGLKAGFAPQDIIFTPNSVALDEILAAKDLGVRINIDNISILEQFGNRFGRSYPISIRLNPHIMAGGNYKTSTGHVDSKFGISIHQLRHVERIIKSTHLHVNGLHLHTGSEIKDVDVFIRGVEIMFEMVQHFEELDFIDLGSGFKVSYRPGDMATDVELLGKKLTTAFNDFCKKYKRPLEMWFEPGKFLVSEAGYFLVRANVIKTTTATVFVGVNSGFNHLIRPMFYDAFHLIRNISNPKGVERIYTVVGNICETDTFGWDRKLNEVREGDYLVFHNAGAYGFEMSSNFNSRLKPAEVLIKDGKSYLIRERDTLDDLLRKQVEVL
ncbi:diaminopimelate decarboxylase [Compostibacter hankyongensis]|uniref:Diaminopimelate decarboxylase n=1 Tax=Compostibacter hankyongensis TaxID=1007089 RepID=A0ABP8FL09_9BACT